VVHRNIASCQGKIFTEAEPLFFQDVSAGVMSPFGTLIIIMKQRMNDNFTPTHAGIMNSLRKAFEVSREEHCREEVLQELLDRLDNVKRRETA
jgi:hypothetical protein